MLLQNKTELCSCSGHLMPFDINCFHWNRRCLSFLYDPLAGCSARQRKHCMCCRELDIDRYVPVGLLSSQAAPKHYIQNLLPAKSNFHRGTGKKKKKQTPAEEESKYKTLCFCWQMVHSSCVLVTWLFLALIWKCYQCLWSYQLTFFSFLFYSSACWDALIVLPCIKL